MRVLAVWEVPIILVAAFAGANRWLDNKLKEYEGEEAEKYEVDKRYQVLADGVVPDLYQFYQEMDGVIEGIQSKDVEKKFCENMDKLVEFMCVCKEPEGTPTVQNMVMMGMSAKNCGLDQQGQQGSSEFASLLRDNIMGEILRTSPGEQHTKSALTASANIVEAMFSDKLSKLSTYPGRMLRGV